MNPVSRIATASGATALVVAGALLVGSLAAPVRTASAQDVASSGGLPRTITVVGEGKVKVEPDIARVSIGVEVVRANVKEASAANEEIMTAVLVALTEAGVAEDDLQTSGFNVYAERFGANGPVPDDEVNYRVSNNVTAVVRDLEKMGDVLDAAIEAGANNIYGVEFALDDPSTIESDARAKAVEDAQAKAAELAELNGVAVGDVISISEVVGNMGFFTGNFSQVSAPTLGGGGGPSLQPGQLSLVMQLQLVYEIAE